MFSVSNFTFCYVTSYFTILNMSLKMSKLSGLHAKINVVVKRARLAALKDNKCSDKLINNRIQSSLVHYTYFDYSPECIECQ